MNGGGNTLDSGGESPERTGNMAIKRSKNGLNQIGGRSQQDYDAGSKAANKLGDERKATSMLLKQAKRTPYDYCKVSFVITLPYEMLIEQI
jgi:hypothetical protein